MMYLEALAVLAADYGPSKSSVSSILSLEGEGWFDVLPWCYYA
jgi:hypothetical protein